MSNQNASMTVGGVVLTNETPSDLDGGRRVRMAMQGRVASGLDAALPVTLANVEARHHGAQTDAAGRVAIQVNSGSGVHVDALTVTPAAVQTVATLNAPSMVLNGLGVHRDANGVLTLGDAAGALAAGALDAADIKRVNRARAVATLQGEVACLDRTRVLGGAGVPLSCVQSTVHTGTARTAWSARWDGVNAQSVNALDVDAAGSVLTGGTSAGGAGGTTFYDATGNLITAATSANADSAAHVVKYSADGVFQWRATVDGVGTTEALDVSGLSTDRDNNVIAGFRRNVATAINVYDSTANGSTTFMTVAGGTANGCFIVKYNSSGKVQWLRRIDMLYENLSPSVRIYVNKATSEIFALYSTYYSGINMYPLNSNNTAAGTSYGAPVYWGIFVHKFSPDGTQQWVVRLDGSGSDYVGDAATDSLGNLYISCSAEFLPLAVSGINVAGANQASVPGSGSGSAVIKLTSAGAFVWAHKHTLDRHALAIGADDCVYYAGRPGAGTVAVYSSALDNYGTALMTYTATQGNLLLLLKMHSGGKQVLWTNRVDGTGNELATTCVVDSHDNVYVALNSNSSNAVVYEGTAQARATLSRSSTDTMDIIVSYSREGRFRGATRVDGTGSIGLLNQMAVGPDHRVYMCGAYQSNPVNFYDWDNSTVVTSQAQSTTTDAASFVACIPGVRAPAVTDAGAASSGGVPVVRLAPLTAAAIGQTKTVVALPPLNLCDDGALGLTPALGATACVRSDHPFDAKYNGLQGCVYCPGRNPGGVSVVHSGLAFNLADPAVGGVTLEAWVKYPSFTSVTSQLVSHGQLAGSTVYWSFGANAAGALQFTAGATTLTHQTALAANQWHHVALTVAAAAAAGGQGTARLFVNGVPSTASASVSTAFDAAVPLTVGQTNNATSTHYVAQVRLVKGAVLYGFAFTPATVPLGVAAPTAGTVALLLTVRPDSSLGAAASRVLVDGTRLHAIDHAIYPVQRFAWHSDWHAIMA